MNPKRRNAVYDKEYELLARAKEVMAGNPDPDTLLETFQALIKGYDKLLRQTEKITRVGDSIQRKLVKARSEIEEKNRELVTAQKRLVRKEKMLAVNTLVAGVAHELRNPLNFINNLSFMQRELASELTRRFSEHPPEVETWNDIKLDLEDLVEGAQIIAEHGSRANAIVSRMNHLSRENPGKPHPTNLNMLLQRYTEQVRKAHRNRCPLPELEIEEYLDPDLGELELVPGDIGFVFTQLLVNAFEAMHALDDKSEHYRPVLQIWTYRVEDGVVFSLRDNGIGIPTQNLSKLFTPFFTTKPTMEGHIGLGLFTCYDIIVQGYGGQIDYHITPDGLTDFSVILPTEKAPQTEA